MLVLFDIDGTLLHSLSAGVHAMTSTLRTLHGTEPDFSAVEVHGRLDTLIWRDLSKAHGYPAHDEAHAEFKRTYGEHLERRLAERNTVERYPGAKELVEATAAVPGMTIGLLTGNYEHTGMLKVRHAGIDTSLFTINAWGDDGPDRRSLVPVAMNRYQQSLGSPVNPRDVVIIGDTPYDVDCAHASGARVIAVATGHFKIDALRAAGADLAVENLCNTGELVSWIMNAK